MPRENHFSEAHWQVAWGVSAQSPNPFFGKQIEIDTQTVRQFITIQAKSAQLRLRLSNAFGSEPVKIGEASIAQLETENLINTATLTAATFGGNREIIIPAGASIVSDAVSLETHPGDRLAISLFLPGNATISTAYCGLNVENYLSGVGNYVNEPELSSPKAIKLHPFLIGADVLTETKAAVIVALGDSITTGYDTNSSWPATLAERLQKHNGAYSTRVINAGIPGNMLLSSLENPNALARFDRDVLSIPGVTHLILSMGINDIGRPNSVANDGQLWQGPLYSPTEFFAAYKQLIYRAHEHDIKIYGCTLTPFSGAFFHSQEKQKVHDEVNSWIRSNVGNFDGIIDFHRVLEDPKNPGKILEKYNLGDFIHPNELGLESMANAIDLSLLKQH